MKNYFALFAIFCFLLFSKPCLTFADEYHELLKESIAADILGEDGEIGQLIPLLEVSMGEQVGTMFAQYAQQQLAEDIATMYEPSYKKYVTTDDLRWIINWSNNERQKAISKKVIQKVANINQDQQVMQYLAQIATGITNIVNGEKASDLEEIPCSENYRKAFNQYIANANLQETMQNLMDGFIRQMVSQKKLSVDNLSAETKNALSDYAFKATKNLCLLLIKDSLTEEDLNYFSENTKSQAYQNLQKASIEIASDPDMVGTALLEGFSKWAEKNYPDKKEIIENLKKQIK